MKGGGRVMVVMEKTVHKPQFLPLVAREVSFSVCFTSTETIRTVRNREPRTTTSTFTHSYLALVGERRVNRRVIKADHS